VACTALAGIALACNNALVCIRLASFGQVCAVLSGRVLTGRFGPAGGAPATGSATGLGRPGPAALGLTSAAVGLTSPGVGLTSAAIGLGLGLASAAIGLTSAWIGLTSAAA